VAVGVANRPRAKLGRIRAGRLRLGHRESRPQLAVEERIEPALYLPGRSREREDLAVARVGSLAAEDVRRVDAGAEDLVHQAELHLPEALTPELGREVRRPQAALSHGRAQRLEDALQVVVADLVRDRLDRIDLLADEVAHPLQLLLEL